jgi:hypothetical protein
VSTFLPGGKNSLPLLASKFICPIVDDVFRGCYYLTVPEWEFETPKTLVLRGFTINSISSIDPKIPEICFSSAI